MITWVGPFSTRRQHVCLTRSCSQTRRSCTMISPLFFFLVFFLLSLGTVFLFFFPRPVSGRLSTPRCNVVARRREIHYRPVGRLIAHFRTSFFSLLLNLSRGLQRCATPSCYPPLSRCLSLSFLRDHCCVTTFQPLDMNMYAWPPTLPPPPSFISPSKNFVLVHFLSLCVLYKP